MVHSGFARANAIAISSAWSVLLALTLPAVYSATVCLGPVRVHGYVHVVCSGVRRVCRRECLGSGEPSFLIVLRMHVPGDGWHVEVAEQVPRERGLLRALLRSLSLVPEPL